MPEALIRQWRGLGADLPESRNSQYAHDVLNVYQSQPGSLSRREGCRRAVEDQFNGPIRLILPVLQPGGEYTGAGLDLIIQDGEYFYGTSTPRSAVVATTPTFVDGVEQDVPDVDYSPHVVGVQWVSFSSFLGITRVRISGRNFDDDPSLPFQVSIARVAPVTLAVIDGPHSCVVFYESPSACPVWIPTTRYYRGTYIRVDVTNPNGETDRWYGWIT